MPPKHPKIDIEGTPEEVREKVLKGLGDDFHIDNLDRAILTIMARYPSATQTAIAEATGYSRGNISVRMAKPAFKAAQNEMNKSILQTLMDAQTDAVKEMRKIVLHNPDPELKIAAARVLLAPLSRIEQGAPVSQNITYAVRFGDGGQLIRESRIMDHQRLIEVSGK